MNGRGAIAALGAALLALVAMQVGIGVDSGIAVVPADVARACLALVGLAGLDAIVRADRDVERLLRVPVVVADQQAELRDR